MQTRWNPPSDSPVVAESLNSPLLRLESCEQTGVRPSQHRSTWNGPNMRYPIAKFWAQHQWFGMDLNASSIMQFLTWLDAAFSKLRSFCSFSKRLQSPICFPFGRKFLSCLTTCMPFLNLLIIACSLKIWKPYLYCLLCRIEYHSWVINIWEYESTKIFHPQSRSLMRFPMLSTELTIVLYPSNIHSLNVLFVCGKHAIHLSIQWNWCLTRGSLEDWIKIWKGPKCVYSHVRTGSEQNVYESSIRSVSA